MPRISDRCSLVGWKPGTRDRKKRQLVFDHLAADVEKSPCCGARIHTLTGNVADPMLEGTRRCMECWKRVDLPESFDPPF